MRVALLTQNARAGDAIGRHVAEKAAYFVDRGAHVRVIIGDDRAIHPALKPHVVPQSDSPRGAGWNELAAADLIVVDYPQYYPLLDLLPLLADGKRRIVFDYHGVTPALGRLANHREASHRGREERGLAGLADAVIPHSQFAERELLEAIAIPKDRIHRLGYVIDAERFTPGAPTIPLRKRLNLRDAKLLLFVGRLAPNKRVPILVKALGDLPEFHAVIVGPCGDIYESERLLCREVAADAGVTDRVHFLGAVDEATLLDCYRSADALVMPSVHEGFCLPVIEAMACGLPVIAARAGALPETVADAGLTFAVDDVADLARAARLSCRVGRGFARPTNHDKTFGAQPIAPVGLVDSTHPTGSSQRIAIVTPAFGETAGGAERSLSLIAKLLHERGCSVEVFTTRIEGPTPSFPVRQFDVEPANSSRRTAAAEQLDWFDAINEATYFGNTLRSTAIVDAIKVGNYDAVIVGPFGNALTRDVIRAAGDRAILVPCLHDELAARTSTVREIFDTARGVLYHSRAEQELGQTDFGFNHPNAAVIGTVIDAHVVGDPATGRKLAGASRYVLICGRKVREKGLPETIDWARNYDAMQPGRFRFVFAGDGDYPMPAEAWAIDLGRVSEAAKFDLMAGANALLQLSANESLSLVVLEAQSLGTPVIVNGSNPTLANHIRIGHGGWAVASEHEFAQALDTLWKAPDEGTERGQSGREYVRREYGDKNCMGDAIVNIISILDRPVAELMREHGLRRAQTFARAPWRKSLDGILESMFDQPSVVTPNVTEITTPQSDVADVMTWCLMLRHRVGIPLVPTGSGRTEIVVRVRTADGDIIVDEWATAISSVLANGHESIVDIALPGLVEGTYALEAGIRTYHGDAIPTTEWHGILSTLTISASRAFHVPHALPAPRFQRSLDTARSLQQLPDGYVDVTTGRFAKLKQRIKDKLLNNFRASYVDVLARQQTRFNRQVTSALAELADGPGDADLRAELATTQARCAELADRLERLESTLADEAVTVGGAR